MPRIIYNDAARRDPEKLQEIRREVQSVGEVGVAMLDLANQLDELSQQLRVHNVLGMEDTMMRIRVDTSTLQRDLNLAFGNIEARLSNEIYIGNLAARRYGVVIQ